MERTGEGSFLDWDDSTVVVHVLDVVGGLIKGTESLRKCDL